jgi:hypothetical protein
MMPSWYSSSMRWIWCAKMEYYDVLHRKMCLHFHDQISFCSATTNNNQPTLCHPHTNNNDPCVVPFGWLLIYDKGKCVFMKLMIVSCILVVTITSAQQPNSFTVTITGIIFLVITFQQTPYSILTTCIWETIIHCLIVDWMIS